MNNQALPAIAALAREKAAALRSDPAGFAVLSMLAGVYVGFAVILVFVVGAPFDAADSPATRLVMSASFGVALSLVVFAGSELFTGLNLIMSIGAFRQTVSWMQLGGVWVVSFAGNLAGSILLALLVAGAGVLSGPDELALVHRFAEAKMTMPFDELFFRAILCNWLVCLAVWCALRMQSEAGKLIMIFWCLFAFVGAGFEHSVANMTLLGVALFQEHPETIGWGGLVHNLVPVTLGNIAGGAIFVAGAYAFAGRRTPAE